VAQIVVGGTLSEVSGGKFANGAAFAAFSAAVQSFGDDGLPTTDGGSDRSSVPADQANSAEWKANVTPAGPSWVVRSLSVVGGVIGKIWTLPNTIIGTIYGGVGYIVGQVGYAFRLLDVRPHIKYGNNAIQFVDNPLTIRRRAITLGNSISYGRDANPERFGAYGDLSVNIGLHEKAHTLQSQVLGPLFLPVYFLRGGVSGPEGNPFERAAQNYGRGIGGWWQ
jgi:hypothetical protein